MTIRTVYLDKKSEEIYQKRFGKSSVHSRKFSEWIRNKLSELEDEKYDLTELEIKKKEIEDQISLNNLKLDEIEKKLVMAKQLQVMKFQINEQEKEYLIKTKEMMELDSSKLYPRMKFYCSEFSKEFTIDEFMELLKLV